MRLVSSLIPRVLHRVYTVLLIMMRSPVEKHARRASWAIIGLQTGAVLFVAGLAAAGVAGFAGAYFDAHFACNSVA